MKEQNVVTNDQAREAIDRILNFCEEIDNHIPTDEKTGYKMLPDYFIVSRYLNEAGYRRQEWISVDDKLPEKEGQYLVYTGLCGIRVCSFRTSIITDRLSFEYNCTHWMPLPEPPKMKGGTK